MAGRSTTEIISALEEAFDNERLPNLGVHDVAIGLSD